METENEYYFVIRQVESGTEVCMSHSDQRVRDGLYRSHAATRDLAEEALITHLAAMEPGCHFRALEIDEDDFEARGFREVAPGLHQTTTGRRF